ncbi:MAG: helix-turn-helix domain-containing protein [Proteobacteria bacterium]|nr:helix-turn-helix domain-containing protein [Pseudomonadota bacterium]
MSVRVQTLVWAVNGRFNTEEKLLLLKLADHADDDGGSIFPGNTSLAEAAEVCERSVQSYLRSLEKLGVLVWVANAGGDRGSRRCRLDLAQLKALAASGRQS